MSELNVKLERVSENHVKLTISVSKEDWNAALDKAFDKVVKEVKVDGFRPGKLPKSIFLQKFGWSSLFQDALDEVINTTYPQAAMQEKIYPTQDPKIDLAYDKLAHDQGFDYTADVDVWPEIHLGEYKGLTVKPLSKRVYKKDIDAFVADALKDKTEMVAKDGVSEIGDTVVIDFEGFVDDKAFAGGKAEKYPLELGSNSFIPGFEEQLVGVKKDDQKDVKVTFPADYQAKELAGKEATFKCTVHDVQVKKVPELTDEIVKSFKIDGVETVEAYQNYAKATLTAKKEKASDDALANSLVDAVCKASYADLPQSLIDAQVASDVKRVEDQAKQYNIPVDALLSYMGGSNMETYKKQCVENSKRMFLQELVFDKIIELEKIEATDEEVEAEYVKLASYTDKDDDAAKAKKLAQVKSQYRNSQVSYKIKADKVVALLKANAVLK
jgi:trigger factor